MLSKQKSNKGMSYVEVAICLFIVSISILPLSQAFVSSVKMREEAESINQTTFYAETLLQETKKQLEKDLSGLRKVEAMYSNKETINPLNEFFEMQPEPFKDIYDTDTYSYELAIWRIKDELEATEEVIISSGLLEKALKFYTDTQYKFSTMDFEKLPKFKLDKDNKHLFKNELFFKNYTPDVANNDSSIVGTNILNLKGGATISEVDTTITHIGKIELVVASTVEVVSTRQKVHVYNIINSGTHTPTIGNETGVVIIDTRNLNSATLQKNILKFNNHSDFPVNLKLLANKDDATIINQNIHIIITDEHPDKKTTLERITYLDQQEDYLIAIIIRNKNPRLGKAGKIVKTMMDIYTFES